MSARYSKTSSRGREIVVETVNGSTTEIVSAAAGAQPPSALRRRDGRSGGATVEDPDGVPELRAVHEPGLERRLGVQHLAELAEHGVALVEEESLADQRRALAPSAALASRDALIDAAAQQRELQIGHSP